MLSAAVISLRFQSEKCAEMNKELKCSFQVFKEVSQTGCCRTVYRNDPKFSDRYAWANSADPDQTVPTGAVWSGSTLFAILSASIGLITLL